MSAISYLFPTMRVAWEGSAMTWMVFMGTPSAPYGYTLGAFVGALVREVKMSSPSPSGRATIVERAIVERACSFLMDARAEVWSPGTVRTPASDGISETKHP